MEILSSINDERINSTNIFVETTIGEYLGFAPAIIDNNEMQRRKVKSSSSVYSLLKTDLKHGCVIPPLVLAVTSYTGEQTGEAILDYIKTDTNQVMILDGLQRTYTMMAAKDELKNETDLLEKYLTHKLRLEIYISINKFGILYRMLTLNTGQTPMSPRHQIEILYKSMLDTEINGVRLVTETSGGRAKNPDTMRFKDAVEGFNSYINRNELPIDRQSILDNVIMLENLSAEDTQKDIFSEFVLSYTKLKYRLHELFDREDLTDEEVNEYKIDSTPFATNVIKAFNSSQALTGFGAAVGRMKGFGIIDGFEMLNTVYGSIVPGEEDKYEWFFTLLVNLNSIKNESKKIGNGQRMYFQYIFRELFNPDSDSYLNLSKAIKNGYQKYRSQI